MDTEEDIIRQPLQKSWSYKAAKLGSDTTVPGCPCGSAQASSHILAGEAERRVESAIDPSLSLKMVNHTQLETKWIMLNSRSRVPDSLSG